MKVVVCQFRAIIYILRVKCIFQHLLHMFTSFNVADFCSVEQMLSVDLYFTQSCRSWCEGAETPVKLILYEFTWWSYSFHLLAE
jgi:hypothetical protein